MDKMKVTYETMLGLVAEMVLDEAIVDFRRRRLYDKIDQALAEGDEASFKKLAEEWKSIC